MNDEIFADLLNRREFAAWWRCSLRTLARLEATGQAPPSIMLGGKRFYRKSTAQLFIASLEAPTRVKTLRRTAAWDARLKRGRAARTA